jgi:preprotein translocase subunit SecF
VVVAVAEARGVAPETLPPLYDAIDTEALERLFAPCCDGAPRVDGHAAFPPVGCEVTVRSDRTWRPGAGGVTAEDGKNWSQRFLSRKGTLNHHASRPGFMARFEVPDVDYTRYTNRQLVALPLGLLAVALAILAGWYVMTGAPVSLGVAFTGGTELQVATDDSPAEIRESFDQRVPYEVQSVQRGGDSYIVTFQATQNSEVEEITAAAEDAGYDVQSVQSRSPRFSAGAQQQALVGIGVAFLGMSVLVFLLFRTFVPSLAVVASAFSDIVIPVALMNLFGIKLTLGTVAALLMLIGYSVDSDLLLNNHVLRRTGDFYESTYRAMRTGVTMTLTSIAAMTVMAVVASPFVFGIPLLPEVGIVLVLGLTADLMNTYLLNVSLLRYYKYEGIAR